MLKNRYRRWGRPWSSNTFRLEFIVSLIFLVIVMLTFSQWLVINEKLPGVALHDPVLTQFAAIDVTMITQGLF